MFWKRKSTQIKLYLRSRQNQNSEIIALKKIVRGRGWHMITMTVKKEHLRKKITKGKLNKAWPPSWQWKRKVKKEQLKKKIKKEDNKRKKGNCDHLRDNKKEQLRKRWQKKKRKSMKPKLWWKRTFKNLWEKRRDIYAW